MRGVVPIFLSHLRFLKTTATPSVSVSQMARVYLHDATTIASARPDRSFTRSGMAVKNEELSVAMSDAIYEYWHIAPFYPIGCNGARL